MQPVPRLVLSATRGGSGKTTLALGMIAAWRKLGKQVAAFKKGPDFIDAGWLGAAAGRSCYNLDPFLMENGCILQSFSRHTRGVDVAVVEGNRGLFDGLDESGTYSSAALAKLLKTPVVLIVDCTKATATMAAVVLGCLQFDPDVDIRGIIVNKVSSPRHESVIRKAIESRIAVPVVGAVPRLRDSEFPERHMGLTPFHEHPDVERAITAAARIAEQHLDLPRIWSMAANASPLDVPVGPSMTGSGDRRDAVTIGVIQDSAFQFYYPDNVEALEQQGAEIKRINALTDAVLPDIDGLYIGGGFPETQAAELAANTTFCQSVKTAAEQGLPVYAECGGLIYLGRSLTVGDKKYPMTGVFAADFSLEKRPQAHGYTVLEVKRSNPFFETGAVLRGHEFHYSRLVNSGEIPQTAFGMQRGAGIDGRDGLLYNNVLAAYTHLHALGTPEWAPALVKKCREYRRARKAGR